MRTRARRLRFIPTIVNGFADWATGLALLATGPWLGFAHAGPVSTLPVSAGALILLVSLLTRYEVGRFPVIPMRAHLAIDGGVGAILVLSPWLFGFAEDTWLPHVACGAIQLAAAALTDPVPGPAQPRMPRAAT